MAHIETENLEDVPDVIKIMAKLKGGRGIEIDGDAGDDADIVEVIPSITSAEHVKEWRHDDIASAEVGKRRLTQAIGPILHVEGI